MLSTKVCFVNIIKFLLHLPNLSILHTCHQRGCDEKSENRRRTNHVRSNSRFDFHSPQKRFIVVFENNTARCFCLLSMEACLYEGADWLSSSVTERWREVNHLSYVIASPNLRRFLSFMLCSCTDGKRTVIYQFSRLLYMT